MNKSEHSWVEKNVAVHIAVEGGVELVSSRQKHIANERKSVGVRTNNWKTREIEAFRDASNRRRFGKDDRLEAKGVLEQRQRLECVVGDDVNRLVMREKGGLREMTLLSS